MSSYLMIIHLKNLKIKRKINFFKQVKVSLFNILNGPESYENRKVSVFESLISWHDKILLF